MHSDDLCNSRRSKNAFFFFFLMKGRCMCSSNPKEVFYSYQTSP